MDEAENAVRKQMKNRQGTETFVASARISVYNKLFGLSPASAYRQPGPFVNGSAETENTDGAVDLGVFNKPKDKEG